jgi:bifunctional NMN adenylyltransferase/nudix hydrolase
MNKTWSDTTIDKIDLAVIIGRFQPLHYGQIYNIDKGLQVANKVVVLVGSAYNSVSPKNPFTYQERENMINDFFFHGESDRVFVEPLPDSLYEENQWVIDVQEAIRLHLPEGKERDSVVLIGHEKDASSYYLNNFPQWEFIETGKWPEKYSGVDATKIRELYYEHDLRYIKGVVPPTTYSFLEKYTKTKAYGNIVAEYNFIEDYKRSWASSPFPPTFNTVDAIVVQSGHILLIKRKENPGKDLWALPGGFLGQEETQLMAVIRELREETKLKVPVPVLKGSITKEKTFSQPSRSQRGRTITQAYLFQLKNDEDLPKVKGNDDAKEAKWIPLVEFYDMEPQMYEDHHHIVRAMVDNT